MQNVTENYAGKAEAVLAAVAYATDSSLLFDWCWKNSIPLRFYGRLDSDVAVALPILHEFLSRGSSKYVCRLVQHHHAKVIWWQGVGVYIGSANLTGSAWTRNVEAGCFFPDEEIDDEMSGGLLDLFSTLDAHSTPLTDELIQVMAARAKAVAASRPESSNFWSSPSLVRWPGLVTIAAKSAGEKKKKEFLEEWHSTLQELRQIGEKVSRPENRPHWISEASPSGAQVDQFLHAHYYERTFDGGRAMYAAHYEENRERREEALAEAINWWRQLPEAPSSEFRMLNVTAPFLQSALAPDMLRRMNFDDFHGVCAGVNAIRDYSRRVSNRAVHLPENGKKFTISEKVEALSRRMWQARTSSGASVVEQIQYVLYGGESSQLPERLWSAVIDPKWKIDGLGVSALGELVGWALPDKFPPRNGRTSKALRSLGFDVKVHVE